MRRLPPFEALLAIPLLLYLPLAGLVGFEEITLPFVAGLLLTAAPLAGPAAGARSGQLWFLPTGVGVAVLVGFLVSGLTLSAPWDALLAGGLLGLPLAILGILLQRVGEGASRFLLLMLALWEGLGLQAAGGNTPAALARSFLTVQREQLNGLSAWASGARGPLLPLASVSDAWFIAFALIALAGAVLALLHVPLSEEAPRTAREFDLWLVTGALAVGALFEALALGVPTAALLGLAVGTLVGVLFLLLSARGHLQPRWWVRRRTPAKS